VTSEDYSVIAAGFAQARREAEAMSYFHNIEGIDWAAEYVAGALEDVDPEFDREAFLEVCGV
jgi:hypothetical protein